MPARYTVGLEWIVAWAWSATGGRWPLHALCVAVTAALASLGAIGVFLATRELCRSSGWASFAAALWEIGRAHV